MKIVDYDTFIELPEGTIYSYWKPCIVRGLYRKGEVIQHEEDERPSSYFEASLRAEAWNGEDPVVDATESRWGVFDYDQLYAVYEADDLQLIIEQLQQAPDLQDPSDECTILLTCRHCYTHGHHPVVEKVPDPYVRLKCIGCGRTFDVEVHGQPKEDA